MCSTRVRRIAASAAMLTLSAAGRTASAQDVSIFTGAPTFCACEFFLTGNFGQTFTTPNIFTNFLGFAFTTQPSDDAAPYSFDFPTELVAWDPITHAPTGGILATGSSHWDSNQRPGPSLTLGTLIQLLPNQMYLALVDLADAGPVTCPGCVRSPSMTMNPTAGGGQSTYAGGAFERCGPTGCFDQMGTDLSLTVHLTAATITTPEPSTLLLVASGLGALIGVQRKRRA